MRAADGLHRGKVSGQILDMLPAHSFEAPGQVSNQRRLQEPARQGDASQLDQSP